MSRVKLERATLKYTAQLDQGIAQLYIYIYILEIQFQGQAESVQYFLLKW